MSNLRNGVMVTEAQLLMLRAMPLAIEKLDGFGRRTLGILCEKGLATEDDAGETAVITEAGAVCVAGGKTNGNGAASAMPTSRRQERDNNRGKGSGIVPAKGAAAVPAAAAPTDFQEIRAQIVARYEADLEALDRVIEICARLEATQ